jgi:prepilin signal peptidase PulO-like enzyme (type II secretory pathway)
MLLEFAFFGVFALLAIQDMKTRQLDVRLTWLLVGIGLVAALIAERAFIHLLFGGLIFFIGWFLETQKNEYGALLGDGDKFVMAAMGFFLGSFLSVGLIIGGILSYVDNRGSKIPNPFVPYLFVGAIIAFMFSL